jgi:outer membrane protein TolC
MMTSHLVSLRWLAAAGLCVGLAAAAGAQTGAGTQSAPAVPPQAAAQVKGAPLVANNTAVPQKLEFLNRGGWLSPWQRYQPANIGMPDLRNPASLEQQAAQGTLYLSLHDMLQLALMSNLDIANASNAQLQAKPDYLRTLAGGSARGVAGETITSAIFSGAIGASGGGGGGGGGSGAGSVSGGGAGVHGGGGGYDPTFNFTFADEHSRQPLNNAVLFGTSEQILNSAFGVASFGQSFTTGTGYSVSFASQRSYQNSNQLFLNPQVASDVSIGMQQELLKGSRRSVNRATMVIGENSLRYADANYKDQVTTVVAQAITQYWTLAAAGRQIEVAEQAEQQAQKTLDDTNALIQYGKVPAGNRITAETGLSTAASAVLQAKTDYAKAASKLKLFLVKQWSPNVIAARVVTTQALPLPQQTTLPELKQMVTRAVNFSPKLAEDRINVSNNDLAVKVRKDTLLPSLTLFASYTSSGVAGVGVNCAVATFPCPAGSVLGALPAGFGRSVGDIFSYKAPDYGVGFALSVPVWNRTNRADEATTELQAAAARVTLQKDENAVTEQVNEDRIELEGQMAQVQAAENAEKLFQQALDNSRSKYSLGKGTIDEVEAAEVALVNAQKGVVAAQQAYAIAQVTLAKDSGTLLDEYNISLGQPLTPQSIRNLH